MSDLELILKLNMDEMEAKAYKLALIWEDLCNKEFPHDRHTKLSQKNPLKCTLFRYCHKLARESIGVIPDSELRLYIMAQLQVLKHMREGNVHAMIGPQILTGKQAWPRWKLWKKRYDKRMAQMSNVEELKITENCAKIIVALQKNKEFLDKENFRSYESISKKLTDMSMIRWLTTGRISPYYAILSPWVNQWLNGRKIEDVLMFDLSLYRPSITPQIETKFREIFPEEFSNMA